MKKFYHNSFWIALILVFFSSSAFVSSSEQSQSLDSFYENAEHPLHQIELTEEIASSGCSSCHMQYSVDGKTRATGPVHDPMSGAHKERLQQFVNTHSQGMAEAKSLDRNKVIAYLQTLE